MDDFIAELSNNFVDSFCHFYSLKPTYFKNSDSFTSKDQILTNRQNSKFYHDKNRVT